MFGLPQSTEIRKPVPKTVIYEKFASEMTAPRRKNFDRDISRIVVVNEISPASVNVREGDSVKAIFAVLVELREKSYDEKNISLIARLFGQRLLIILHLGGEYQLAIYETKILHSDWMSDSDQSLRLEGLNLDNVWQGLVTQVSGIVPKDDHTLDEQIFIEGEKEKLRKQIKELEAKAARETQSKKKYELHLRILSYKKKLEEM